MDWLAGCDVVINCAGALWRNPARLEALHHHGPLTLARLAADLGVACWVQLSALGAAPDAPSVFLASKGRGDLALRRCPLPDAGAAWVQPVAVDDVAAALLGRPPAWPQEDDDAAH